MNTTLLQKHIKDFIKKSKEDPTKASEEMRERQEHFNFYMNYTKEKILKMTEEDIYDYISKLWAMLLWGNKHYVVNKIIEDNGIQKFRESLAELVWSSGEIVTRWDNFRSNIKGMGPAMISEILCKSHFEDYMLWNRRACVALNFLGVKRLPRYDYHITGKMYKYLCSVCKEIAGEMKKAGVNDTTMLAVNYFFWSELQVEDNLSAINKKEEKVKDEKVEETADESKFKHNDIRDKLSEIGRWLGFDARIEQKVAEGSKVDTIWEATIGNMGRVIYVFEVQTKGSIDSLILNLLKSLNNPAVQGVVAVSDEEQLDRIKKQASEVKDLREKLRYWNYEEVLEVHKSLEYVNEKINTLRLVPQGF